MKDKKLPDIDSIDELARFWDNNDLTDFEDVLEQVKEPVFIRKEGAIIQLHLSIQENERLKRLANDKGVDSVRLVQEWVSEKLQVV